MLRHDHRSAVLPQHAPTSLQVRLKGTIAGKLLCSLLADGGPDLGRGPTAVMAESYYVD